MMMGNVQCTVLAKVLDVVCSLHLVETWNAPIRTRNGVSKTIEVQPVRVAPPSENSSN